MNAAEESSTPAAEPSVWLTVVDPEREDGRTALTEWDGGHDCEWAVPANARAGDRVLAWITGGTGLRYVLEIVGSPRAPAKDEFGPKQALLRAIESIHPSIPMSRLKNDRVVRSWWPVLNSMQGVVRAQRESITRDRAWPSLLRLIDSAAPRAAAKLHRRGGEAAATAQRVAAEPFTTVSCLDEGSTEPVPLTVTKRLADVLVCASAINEKRSGFDLSFSSLLLAVYFGGGPLGTWLADYIKEQGVRIDHPLLKVGRDRAAAEAAAGRGRAQRGAILASPFRRTASARQALDEAARIAGAQSVWSLDVVHLVAALISLTDYHEQDFTAMSLDRQRWGAAFVQHVVSQTSDAAELAFWRRFYERRFPGHTLPPLNPRPRKGRRPDYDADAYSSTDLLDIDDEVSALAAVIASKQTKPPIAVGLFGDWGSGKTFFMKHLRRRVEQICDGARQQSPAERECHANIAQIEFNAWHYQEGDLWASLVDHILRNLRFGEHEDEARVRERQSDIVRQLSATEAQQKAADEKAGAADRKVTEAEEQVGILKMKESAARSELADQLRGRPLAAAVRATFELDAVTEREAQALADTLGIPEAERRGAELRDALADARRELRGIGAFLIPLLRADDRRTRVVYLLAALLAPTLGAIAVYLLMAQPGAVATLSTVSAGALGLIGTTTTWLQKQTAWVKQTRAALEPIAVKVNQAVDAAIDQAVQSEKAAVAAKLAELDTLRQQQAAAQKERDAWAAQAAALKQSLAVLGDEELMRTFLEKRIGGGDYEKKLGVAALVRRDFERLSRHIEQVTEREAAGTLNPKEVIINRVVLYIDDLDRCEANIVVAVLRAVHLLMAFPAFVVIVGVDSRWMARCLQEHLTSVFAEGDDDGAGRAVTPLDYLEKIFQIPIWLEPVRPDRRVQMARSLLRKPIPFAAPPAEGVAPPDSGRAAEPGQALDTADPAEETPEPRAVDLNPQGLDITDGEFAFLGDLGNLLSPSPRVIKRFVNTYRLINVLMKQTGVDDEARSPDDAHVRMLLLAILVDMPELSRGLQEALRHSGGANPAITPFIQMADARYAGKNVNEPDLQDEFKQWQTLRQWIVDRGEPWASIPAARFTAWLTPIGRYTFNLSRARDAANGQPDLVTRAAAPPPDRRPPRAGPAASRRAAPPA